MIKLDQAFEEGTEVPESKRTHIHKVHSRKPKIRHKRIKTSEALQVTSNALVSGHKKERDYVTRVLGGTADETILLSADVIYNLFSQLADYAD